MARCLFFSVWFSTMFVVYLLFYGHDGSVHNLAAVVFGGLASFVLWLETAWLWLKQRSKKVSSCVIIEE